MEEQMSDTAKARRDREELRLYRAIALIDLKLEALAVFRKWYPAHKAPDDELPCAVHSAPLSS
jgi:hypothetical protein